MMRLKSYLCLVLCLATFCGCHHDIFSKRRSEFCCPTDIRQKHPFRWGEDALLRGPCGPDAEFYGLKPTGWRLWPTSGAQWRDAYGAPITEAERWVDEDSVMVDQLPQPETNETPDLSDPFRDDPKALPESEGIDPPTNSPGSSQIEQSVDSLSRTLPEPNHVHHQGQLLSETKLVPTPSLTKNTSASKRAATSY